MSWTRGCGICVLVMLIITGCTTAPVPSESEAQLADRAMLEASFNEALFAMDRGELGEAQARFQALARDYPEKAGPMANLGIIAYQSDDLETARRWFERVLEVNPQHVQALNHLGVMARNAGEFGDAERYYRAALAADPDYAPAILNLAFLLDIYLGEPSEAVALYERYEAVASEPHPSLKDWVFDAKNRI